MTELHPRMRTDADPAAYRAMGGLEAYLAASSLPKPLRELVKLRVSQLNGCSFCVDMHAHDALADGETTERLFAVAAWREAPYFTDAERAALALAESATRLGPEGVPDDVWNAAAACFDEAQLVALVMTVATINAWNRLSITFRTVAGSLRAAAGSGV